MNITFTPFTFTDFYTYALIGSGLALLHLFLLWQIVSLYKSKKHSFVIFLANTLQIFLVIFIALACAQSNMTYFLIIICFFLLLRIILLSFLTPSLKKKIKKGEIMRSNKKKTIYTEKKQRKHKRKYR